VFADGYSLCAQIGSRIRERRLSHYRYAVTRHQHRKFCRLIRTSRES
jgi:hypothetical protein